MNSIHSLRGIPAGAFNYDHISRLQSTVASRDSTIGSLTGQVGSLTADLDDITRYRDMWRDLAVERRGTIEDYEGRVIELWGRVNQAYDEIYAPNNFWETATGGLCSDPTCGYGAGALPDFDPRFTCEMPRLEEATRNDPLCNPLG
jgi:hypothetical protein